MILMMFNQFVSDFDLKSLTVNVRCRLKVESRLF